MRIEGQGMAVDYSSAKNEAVSQSGLPKGGKEGGEKKIGLEDIKPEYKYTDNDLSAATDTVNKALKMSNYHLEFKLHRDSGRYQVKVVDSDSQEVIREIPPENVLEFSAQVRHMLNEMIGVLVDELV
jgi:flagellar protein FlaG